MGTELGQRVLVIGCCGAGKSTLSKRLAALTGLPLVHMDCLYWKSGWQPVTDEELHALLEKELAKERWILDGNFGSTLEWRLSLCDGVIWMDYPRIICLMGVLHRWRHKDAARTDITQGCDEHWDWPFLRFVWTFKRKHDQRFARLLGDAAASGKTVLRLKNRREAEKLLEAVAQATGQSA